MQERIRSFTRDDIEFALAQTAREGWHATAEQFELALMHDSDGCFIAESAGAPVGMITTTCYAVSAWIGHLIVVPDYRRRGLGERMIAYALDYLARRGYSTVRLEADPMGVGIYRRLGFERQFRSLRFRSDPPHNPILTGTGNVVPCGDGQQLAAVDRHAFGDDRQRLLAGLVAKARATFAYQSPGEIQGYAVVFPSAVGVHLGPWIATDREVAASLIDRVLTDFAETSIIVGVSETNRDAIDLLKDRGFRETESSLRMIRGGPAPDGNSERLFAIANGAMG